MDHVGTLFPNIPRPNTSDRRTERGELLKAFLSKLNPGRKAAGFKPYTIERLAEKLTGILTPDLYYLQKHCDEAERAGYPWSAIFEKAIKPDKISTN